LLLRSSCASQFELRTKTTRKTARFTAIRQFFGPGPPFVALSKPNATGDYPRVPARVPVGTAGKDPRFVYKSAKADRRQHPYGDPMGYPMESPRARRVGHALSACRAGRPALSPWARGGHLHHGQRQVCGREGADRKKPARPFQGRSGLRD
jgi:hypothetical protein